MSPKKLKAFWWSPLRSPRLAFGERRNLAAWATLGRQTGRPFLNFGDELSPLVLSHVIGRDISWAPPHRADIVSIGSILELAFRRGSTALVWGTGLRDPSSAAEIGPSMVGRTLAVRGHWTKTQLGLAPETPVGDPGLLAYRLSKRSPTIDSNPLLLPHFSTWASGASRSLVRKLTESMSIVEPSLAPLDVLDRIARAPVVFSSSLHGVIVAHSLGTPAVLIQDDSHGASEPSWKYGDYASSLSIDLVSTTMGSLLDQKMVAQTWEEASSRVELIQERALTIAERLEAALLQAYQ